MKSTSPAKFFTFLCDALLVLILNASQAFAQEPAQSLEVQPVKTVVGRTLAIVNNEPIFSSELDREADPFIERFKKTAPDKEQTPEKMASLKKEILDRLIEEKLLLQEARNKKIRVTKVEIEKGIGQFKEPFSADAQGKTRQPAQVERAFQDQLIKEGMSQDQFNRRVEEQLMKVKLIEQDVKAKVEMPKDEETQKFFEKIQKKIAGKPVETSGPDEETDLVQISKYLERMTGEQVRIRHILMRSVRSDLPEQRAKARKKLDDILARIRNGEDFAFLAKKFTDDPMSKERGGDLGFIAKGDMGLPEIDAAAFKMKEGDVSGVLETEIGFDVIKLIEKKAPHPLEYDEISNDLKNYIAQRNFTQKLEKYLKDLRVKASVKVNPID